MFLVCGIIKTDMLLFFISLHRIWKIFVFKLNTHTNNNNNKNNADDVMDLTVKCVSIKKHLFLVLRGIPGDRHYEIVLYKSSLDCV